MLTHRLPPLIAIAVLLVIATGCSEQLPTEVLAGSDLIAVQQLDGNSETGLASSTEDHRADVFIQVPEACGMFDGNGDGVGGQDADVNVFTQSRNGNAIHNCHLDVPNDQGRAVRWTPQNNPLGFPFPCFILDGPFGDPDTEVRTTMHWKMTISASGEGKLTCIAR
jgi:hypothetical protein